jgi:sugar lactone lactonase YvrE
MRKGSSGRSLQTAILLTMLAAAVLLAGCSASPGSAGQGGVLILPVETIAGVAGTLGNADGSGISASFSSPQAVVGVGTNLYIADTGNGSIRKLDLSTGAVSTLATGFSNPHGITSDGTFLYVCDTGNQVIKRVDPVTGAVTVFAGTVGSIGFANGTGPAAQFNYPYGIATDGTNLYVTDTYNETIRKIVISSGAVTTLAGTALTPGSTDATGAAARFFFPYGIAVAGSSLYIADSSNFMIRQLVIATAAVTTIAGQVLTPGSTDATGLSASFNQPTGLATDGTSLYVADTYNHTIRKMDISSSAVTTFAGQPGIPGGMDGAKYSSNGVYAYAPALFNDPVGVSALSGKLYVADTGNSVIREIQ